MKASDFDWVYGISSKIKQRDDGPFTGSLPGDYSQQLLMHDLDGYNLNQARTMAENLDDGIFVLQQSSTDSFNIISLNTYDRRTVIERKASASMDDAKHLKIGIDRGYWITRVSCKGRSKRGPVLVDVYDNREHEDGYSVPIPLYNLFDGLYDGFRLVAPDDISYFIGTEIKMIKYASLAEKDVSLNELREKVLKNTSEVL